VARKVREVLDRIRAKIKSRVQALDASNADPYDALLTICVEVDDGTELPDKILKATIAAMNERFDSIQN
jgi:hypothetical protein